MTDLTIRTARPADEARLRRIAALDSQNLPAGDLLVAEVDGRVQAAVARATHRVIANPFVPTADLVALLTAADQPRERGDRAGYRRRHGGLRLA